MDNRDEGGAYCSGGRAGYGSMISTSWSDDVPNPALLVHISNNPNLTLEGDVDGRFEVLDSPLLILSCGRWSRT